MKNPEEMNKLLVNDLCLLLLFLQLKVEAQEESFLIKVLSEKIYRRLLMFILEVFQELSPEVLDVVISCVDNFCLEVVGNKIIANNGAV